MHRLFLGIPRKLGVLGFGLVCLLGASHIQAAAIFAPSDAPAVIGGRSDGANFVVGAAGNDGGGNVYTDNFWPTAESPDHLVDGIPQKYLNFAELNTGFILKPGFNGGAGSIATSLQVFTANDSPDRDPTSYQLYGTNSSISGAGPFPLNGFTLITSGALSLPAGRNNGPTLDSALSQTVTFANSTAYSTYMVLFPTVNNETTSNSMQVSEVQLFNTPAPEPGSLAVLGLGGLILARRRR